MTTDTNIGFKYLYFPLSTSCLCSNYIKYSFKIAVKEKLTYAIVHTVQMPAVGAIDSVYF